MTLLTATEVCEQLNVSRSWLYRAASTGLIPSVRLGDDDGPLRFVQADLDAWLDQARGAWKPGDTTTQTLERANGQESSS